MFFFFKLGILQTKYQNYILFEKKKLEYEKPWGEKFTPSTFCPKKPMPYGLRTTLSRRGACHQMPIRCDTTLLLPLAGYNIRFACNRIEMSASAGVNVDLF